MHILFWVLLYYITATTFLQLKEFPLEVKKEMFSQAKNPHDSPQEHSSLQGRF